MKTTRRPVATNRLSVSARCFARLIIFSLSLVLAAQLHAKPLKVFILAGQSNMEGPASIETIDYIGDDPATAPLLKQMRGADGKPAVCEGVWISYLTGANDKNFELNGKLTLGYGSMWGLPPTKPGNKIGPEFTFGLTMDAALSEPVLIIKTAWGGKSLHTDFRPPSAGPYQLNDYQKKLYYGPPGHGVPKDMDVWLAEKKTDTGHYYRLMVEQVKKVLADPKRVVPGYDAAQGYELAGFVWLQGFNDMVDDRIERGEMAGYLLVPNEKVPTNFNAGFSMYVAAWPLVKTYPGSRFQTGLFGTWMFAQDDTKPAFKSHPPGR